MSAPGFFYDMNMSIAILVNSCDKYADKTLPPLLLSLRQAGVRADTVFVVVGESPTHVDQTSDDEDYRVHVALRPYVNVDNNAFVWLVESENRTRIVDNFDWIFYTHDTTLVTPAFLANLTKMCEATAPDVVALKINKEESMSIGLYRPEAIWAVRDEIRALKNTRPDIKQMVKQSCEDSVFDMLAGVGTVDHMHNPLKNTAPAVNAYGTDTIRILETWDAPGLIKFKANWNQGPCTCEL